MYSLPVVVSLIGLGVFVGVLSVAYALNALINPTRTAQDRLGDLAGKSEGEAELFRAGATSKGLGSPISALATPQDESEANLLRKRLLQSGYNARNALEIYSAARALLALLLPVLAFFALASLAPRLDIIYKLFWVLGAAALGYYLPGIWVTNRLQKRQEALLKPFPDALDLLVSSVEAGLGLDAAFQRVAAEMESAAPVLATELQLVNQLVSTGMNRIDALRRLDERTGLAEVNSLVNVLTQAERFGTSVAQALRVHGDLVRRKRMLAAEEQAAQISPKLTVAMIIFILPTIFTVLIGPAVINVARNLLPMLNGAGGQ